MGYLCDFCGEQRSMIYCRSDAASLCLSCDRNVHSANALSKRHSRTLVCERCNSQPAFVRCVEERVSMCQNCDRREHAASTSSSSHKKQMINCYSGCLSVEELSTIWPFLLDNSASLPDDSAWEQGMGLLTIAENSLNNNLDAATGDPNDDHRLDKSGAWMGCSSTPDFVATKNLDKPSGSGKTVSPKTYYPGTESTAIYEEDFFAQLDMDDFDMNFENYEELFGLTHTHSEQLLENGGLGDLFMTEDISAADSGCQSTAGAEVSINVTNAYQPACSNAASADSIMSIKTEPPICFGARQAHSGVSFSGLAVESSEGDYQDCGVSSMQLLGEPPWCPPENSLLSASRTDAVMRYREKKKSRKFEKKVRYASRKARADVRKRVKGRFVKAGDAYDYDPLIETRSF